MPARSTGGLAGDPAGLWAAATTASNGLPDLTLLAVAAGLVVLAGGFAMTDAALGAVSPARAGELAREGERGARTLQAVAADAVRHINLLLLLRLLCELTATTLVALVAVDTFGAGWSAALVTAGAMTVVSFVVVGVAPRTIGRQHAYAVGRATAPLVRWLGRALNPLASLLILIGNAVTPGRGFREGPFATQVELRELVDLAEQRGVVEHGEREMIHSVFALGDTIAREVMVPRTEMVWIESEKTLRQALALFLRSGFSRIPVVGESVDDVLGVLYLKDVILRTQSGEALADEPTAAAPGVGSAVAAAAADGSPAVTGAPGADGTPMAAGSPAADGSPAAAGSPLVAGSPIAAGSPVVAGAPAAGTFSPDGTRPVGGSRPSDESRMAGEASSGSRPVGQPSGGSRPADGSLDGSPAVGGPPGGSPLAGESLVCEIMREATFVPESKPVDDLLSEMQVARTHLAIVVDEYGGTAGLVTIEDILEEIVGEITDEYDVERPPVERLADGAVRVTARLPIEDLGELFDVELPADEVETVAGLLAQALGRVPIPGAAATVGGLRLVAEGTTGRRNRIDTVLVRRAAGDGADPDGAERSPGPQPRVEEKEPADA